MNFAAQLLGDAWSLLVIRDLMFKGKRTYAEFSRSEERISTNILADRLRSLVREGLVRKEGRGRGTRYSLTEKGIDLLPVLVEIIIWSARHDPKTATPAEFVDRATTDRDRLLVELRDELMASHLDGGAV